MFKFGFNENEHEDENSGCNSNLVWLPAAEVKVTDSQISQQLDDEEISTIDLTESLSLKVIRSENVVLDLLCNENGNNIAKAESQHSDLIPAVYEGGLKVWECSYDLAQYLLKENIPKNSRVLDLGCGAGVLGIVALLQGSLVDFQDYNAEVIQLITIPNVLLNLKEQTDIQSAKFFSGDWAAFTDFSKTKYPKDEDKYDVILSSETIYNPENQKKLLEVFKQRLSHDGVGYIAAKTYYFGVGGGLRQFESLIAEDATLNVENVWKSSKGLQREIIKLTKRPNKLLS